MKKINISKILLYLFISLFSLFCFVPLLLTFMVSITDEDMINKNGYSFIPEKISFYAYKLIFQSGSSVLRGFGISIMITLIGTLLAILITAMAGYTLSNKNVKYRKVLSLYFFITMIFTAGIVPWYLLCKQLHLTDNIFALIIPSLMFNPFNLFLVKNFMEGIPDALRESATIDGANDVTIAFRIYFPLCTPVLATVGLFYGLAYWNDWWNAIMLVSNEKLYPLQYLLLQLQSHINMINQLQSITSRSSSVTQPTESIKMATALVTIGPIVLLYPYLQKYFVKGLVIGSVKG